MSISASTLCNSAMIIIWNPTNVPVINFKQSAAKTPQHCDAILLKFEAAAKSWIISSSWSLYMLPALQ